MQALPAGEPTELFGLHPNASIAKNLKNSLALCEQLAQVREVEGLSTSQAAVAFSTVAGALVTAAEEQSVSTLDQESRVAALCEELLVRLPREQFDVAAVRVRYPAGRDHAMNSLLIQELQRYNSLLRIINTSVTTLIKTLKGEELTSDAAEELFDAFLHGKVPRSWLSASYPTTGALAPYIADLRKRVSTFAAWATSGPPGVFWLPGFFSPTAFLTAILQQHARCHTVAIDCLDFSFRVDPDASAALDDEAGVRQPQQQPGSPQETLVHGLFLEGAAWSADEGALCEARSGKLYEGMPPIALLPTQRGHRQPSRQAQARARFYACPLYRTAARSGALARSGQSSNWILDVQLSSGASKPSHWTKRGVALLCSPPG